MPRLWNRTVRLSAKQAVELEPGVVLPPGKYEATKTRTDFQTMSGGVSWTPPRYTIEFTADQFASMGATDSENLISRKIDVTPLVRARRLLQHWH
jgi:hypothetical protein